ncbi:hypothetical protein SAMN05444671_3563 [Flavobacterium sp. CF108]|uniref:DUF6630 family protein n=1 Tax=unclassified Flavobacterium TaxID=196869 RepID=UPI0008C29FAF|nr:MULTISPECIES: hypothetical protein [unclassified Flavobacterium]SEO48273.1 hypothetical protein SAMN04487978_2997 [Flavobacterium sp. fv08]SHH71428.1 hypothetical protein SAMN05444671_3563 [Flavobacterium sp. CF108]
MKNFFSNLFNRNNDPKSIISFDVIDPIYLHLYNEQPNLEFKVKGIQDNVSVNLYCFPGSLDHEEGRAEIKKAGFNNAYEVLNELYKKIDIGVLSQETIEQGLEYDFIHIEFYSEPSAEVKKYLKRVVNNFIIFFCCTNSLETNDFKILYSSSHFLDYTKGLLDAELLDINNPKNETQQIAVKDFKIVLQGICQYLNIEILQSVELPSSENLIENEEVTIETFEEFIKLVSRENIEEKELKTQSKKLFKNYQKEIKEYHTIIEGHYDLFEIINTWNSDWKFDPEDAEYFISEMIGEDLNFEYPEETYSHDLFPYIQSTLEKRGFELMSYNTNGDNYLFFIANKHDVGRILELSELTKIEIDQL